VSLPDVIEIVPLEKPVRAEIAVPGSKSITNRALILAALADGEVTLNGALWSEDTQIMVECLQELGFMVDVRPDTKEFCNRTITVYGKGGAVPPGGTEQQPMELFVGNAGTAARFLSAFVCLGRGVYRLHGVQRMHERPQAALFDALRQLGYRVEAEQQPNNLPAKVFVGDISGFNRIAGNIAPKYQEMLTGERRPTCKVSIEESSQFASALLLCAPVAGWDVEVTGENAEESPYVAMTSKLIETFPKRGGKFQIEPDASSGSYFWAAGTITGPIETREHSPQFGGEVTTLISNQISVASWPHSGWQFDEAFLDFVRLGGAFPQIRKGCEEIKKRPPGDTSWPSPPEPPYDISRMSDLGDSIMTAIVIAPLNRETIRFTDLGRLRMQECERVFALRTELTKCGAKVVEDGDTLTVYPSTLHGAEIETYEDHRMAMCFAILGLKVPGIKIKNPACVRKTFPNFFQKLADAPPHGLGATIRDAQFGRELRREELFAD
jgi:3-phosphoshikimate 1-carboxyvinyltransferase